MFRTAGAEYQTRLGARGTAARLKHVTESFEKESGIPLVTVLLAMGFHATKLFGIGQGA